MGTGSCNMAIKGLLLAAADPYQSKPLHFTAFLYISLTAQKRLKANVLTVYPNERHCTRAYFTQRYTES